MHLREFSKALLWYVYMTIEIWALFVLSHYVSHTLCKRVRTLHTNGLWFLYYTHKSRFVVFRGLARFIQKYNTNLVSIVQHKIFHYPARVGWHIYKILPSPTMSSTGPVYCLCLARLCKIYLVQNIQCIQLHMLFRRTHYHQKQSKLGSYHPLGMINKPWPSLRCQKSGPIYLSMTKGTIYLFLNDYNDITRAPWWLKSPTVYLALCSG